MHRSICVLGFYIIYVIFVGRHDNRQNRYDNRRNNYRRRSKPARVRSRATTADRRGGE